MVGVALLLAIGLGTGTWMVGTKLTQPSNRVVGNPPPGLPIDAVDLLSRSGTRLAAWHLKHPNADATVVLLHPIRSDRRAMLGRAAMLYDAGYSCLLVDHQAHGESPGAAITFGHLERNDARAAVDYVRDHSPSDRIAVIGWSLGGAAALLASPLSIDAMVIESVYPTIDEATDNRVAAKLGGASKLITPVMLAQLGPRLQLKRADLRPIDAVSKVGCPLLLLAGDKDHHTTLAETQRMYVAASEPKQLAVFAGAKHEDLLQFAEPHYRATVLKFLESSLRVPK